MPSRHRATHKTLAIGGSLEREISVCFALIPSYTEVVESEWKLPNQDPNRHKLHQRGKRMNRMDGANRNPKTSCILVKARI